EAEWYQVNEAAIESLVDIINKSPKKAEPTIERLVKDSPNPLPLMIIAAKKLIEGELYKEAESILQQAVKLDPNSVGTLLAFGKVLHFQNRHTEALQILSKIKH